MLIFNRREDFDNVEPTAILNSLDTDNLTLGAEGNINFFFYLKTVDNNLLNETIKI